MGKRSPGGEGELMEALQGKLADRDKKIFANLASFGWWHYTSSERVTANDVLFESRRHLRDNNFYTLDEKGRYKIKAFKGSDVLFFRGYGQAVLDNALLESK